MSTQPDDIEIRRTIRKTLEQTDDHPTKGGLVETAATVADAPEQAVETQLDELEAHGFVYIVDKEVKLV